MDTRPTSELRRSSSSTSPSLSSPRMPLPCTFLLRIIIVVVRGLTLPRLCGGLTVYSPMVRNGAGPGKKIGVVGLGGL